MEYEFRKGLASDGMACARILHAWGAETPWMVPFYDLEPLAEFWAELLTKDFGYVAHDQGRVVGFCSREDDNVSGLFILKEARGCGVGKRLLDLAKADRDWITVWAYEANTGARKFYHREGLVEIKRELEEFDDGNSLMDVEHRWTRQT